MLCDELYKLGEKYLSREGQKLVEQLVADKEMISAKAVLAGGVLAQGNQIALEDRLLFDELLRNFSSSLGNLS